MKRWSKRIGWSGMPGVLSVAMVALVLAMMVLPLATPAEVAADDDDKPTVKLTGNAPIIDVGPNPTPTPSVPIILPGDVDPSGDEEPQIDPPGDIDIPVDNGGDNEPQIDVPVDVVDGDGDPRIDPPDGIDIVPDPSVIDLPDCVDTDGGEVIRLPGDWYLIGQRSLRLEQGMTLDLLQNSPLVAGLFGDLLRRPGVTVNLPPGVDIDVDQGVVIIPECEAEDSPIIRLPPGVAIDLDGDGDGHEDEGEPPVIHLPSCVENEDDGAINFPPGAILDVDKETGDIILPPGLDVDLGAGKGTINLPPGTDLDLSRGVRVRLPAGVDLDVDGDDPSVVIPVCDPAGEEPGYVTVHKYACLGTISFENPDLDTLRDACGSKSDVTFTLHNTNVDLESEEDQTTDADGLAMWSIEKPNHLTIAETIPDGFQDGVVVFCGVIQGTGQFPQSLALVDAPGAVVNADLAAGDQLYCDWFNRAKPIVIDIPNEPTSIFITKHICPVGVDAAADYGTLITSCTQPGGNIPFGYSGGGNWTWDTTDQNGMVIFDGFEPYGYWIAEQKQPDFGLPIVLCTSKYQAGDPVNWAAQSVYDEGDKFDIYYGFHSGEKVFCDWFNMPVAYEGTDDSGDVVIFKFECPVVPDLSGFDYDSTPEGCVPLPGIEFTLSYGIDMILTAVTSDAEAVVAFDGLPAATLSIGEMLPAGYDDPVVTCDSTYQTESGPVENRFDPILMGSAFAYDLKEGEHLLCFWLNIPDQDGSITIVKYTCSPGFDLYAPGADPEYDCPDATDGIVFTLDTPAGGVQGATGDAGTGTLTFDALPAGSYTITEQVPNGTASVFVLSCQSERAKWIQGYPLAVGNSFALDLLGGDHVICSWYNVPKEPNYGTITVVKYACSTATFVNPDDCELYEGGAAFHLSVSTGSGWAEAAQGTTNSNGMLSWYGLEPGTYELDEVGGTWCFANSDRTDVNGNLVVVAGEETTVWVYNCGVKAETKKPQRFPNTGVGETTRLSDHRTKLRAMLVPEV